jgi:hypothetical protein
LLWGRKLDEICSDFESNGINFDHLYSGLGVPVDWIDLDRFKELWYASVLKACALFNHSIKKARLGQAFEKITTDGNIDFGLLDESSQKRVISHLMSSGSKKNRLIRINPYLSAPGAVADKDKLIADNKKAILARYRPELYRKRLLGIYGKVSTTPVRQQIDKSVLVSSFLNPENFSLLKWSDYSEDKC